MEGMRIGLLKTKNGQPKPQINVFKSEIFSFRISTQGRRRRCRQQFRIQLI